MNDYTDKISEDVFRQWWYEKFNTAIDPKDEFYYMLYVNYCLAEYIRQGIKDITKKEKDNPGVTFNFSTQEAVTAYAEYAERSEKKKFRFILYVASAVVALISLALWATSKTAIEQDLSYFYDHAAVETIQGTPYIKLRPLKTGETYHLGEHAVLYNDSTIVIPLSQKKMKLENKKE